MSAPSWARSWDSRRSTRRLVVALACASVPGCASTETGPPVRPALISHPVFIQLHDPDDADELIDDCDRWISAIPTIASYACGPPFDSGRDTVDANYDVGLIVGFDSPEGYAAYVEHPNHVRLLEKWRPRVRSLLIRDVIDPTP